MQTMTQPRSDTTLDQGELNEATRWFRRQLAWELRLDDIRNQAGLIDGRQEVVPATQSPRAGARQPRVA